MWNMWKWLEGKIDAFALTFFDSSAHIWFKVSLQLDEGEKKRELKKRFDKIES